jgi:hypothetical protein
MKRIYIASSWRNPYQQQLVKLLREVGNQVYDFKDDTRYRVKNDDPQAFIAEPQSTSFSWSELDVNWKDWSPKDFRQKLISKDRASHGFIGDLRGMEWANTCILCQPCGNSAHIEAGYMKGRGKRLIIYYENNNRFTHNVDVNKSDGETRTWKFEPDLMYLLADNIVIGREELLETLKDVK